MDEHNLLSSFNLHVVWSDMLCFTGPIPNKLCSDLPNLVDLDLSRNKIQGSIPSSLAECKFMNDILLNNNELSGTIPEQIGYLNRLQRFDVSSNRLEGFIPSTLVERQFENRSGFDASSFLNNTSLCGRPLKNKCARIGDRKGATAEVIVGGAVGSAVGVLFIGAIIFCCIVRSTNKKRATMLRDESKWASRIKAPKSVIVSMFEKPLVMIRLSDLMDATNGFSKENIVASGRSGIVYIGDFTDGSVMAIKRLQGPTRTERQFRGEMDSLGQIHHRNLVPVLGYCVVGQERLLVCKHMSNGSLNDRLHDAFEKEPLDWKTRLKIAIGASRGFAWLHHSCNPRIIHRNISSNCILLDDEFEPRITDFGLARVMKPVDTHINTAISGDFGDVGYVAPEYVRTLVATMRGDVYSFGVVLLELVTARKPVDVVDSDFKGTLVEWVGVLVSSGCITDALDSSLRGKGVDGEMLQVLKIALSCVQAAARERPSMYQVSGLLHAVGQHYNFSDDCDEFPVFPETERRYNRLVVSVT
ncbi:probable inactive receptor kinase At1g27190 [Physcomitrium patens]|uniref:non-specific serine/threonine protein kinase n=1 Tax=Physcomitrium patens TaxID=3218 RepID=A0A2K1JIL5_PHYPA|nr:hypothetical protein PHYPA_018559 [Physcomitrium patens]